MHKNNEANNLRKPPQNCKVLLRQPQSATLISIEVALREVAFMVIRNVCLYKLIVSNYLIGRLLQHVAHPAGSEDGKPHTVGIENSPLLINCLCDFSVLTYSLLCLIRHSGSRTCLARLPPLPRMRQYSFAKCRVPIRAVLCK